MKDNLKHGETKMFYESGEVASVTTFVDNIEKGEQFTYYKNGNLSSKYVQPGDGSFVDYYQYYPNGQLSVYAKRLVNGEINIYESLGNRTYDLLYKNGELIDTIKVY